MIQHTYYHIFLKSLRNARFSLGSSQADSQRAQLALEEDRFVDEAGRDGLDQCWSEGLEWIWFVEFVEFMG